MKLLLYCRQLLEPIAGEATTSRTSCGAVMSALTDYSKWDSLDVSDSDEEERGRPQVTRLDQPSSVTIGPSGASLQGLSDARQRAPSHDDAESDDEEDDGADHVEELEPERAADDAAPPPLPPRDTSRVVLADATRNGGRTPRYLWSQGKGDAQLCVFVPAAARARDVAAVEVSKWAVRVALRDGAGGAPTELLAGEFAYPVECDEDETDGGVEWELRDAESAPPAVADDGGGGGGASAVGGGAVDARRLLCLPLRKSSPPGVVVWWLRALRGDADPGASITLDAIAERDRTQQEVFQQSWDEAHRQFRENNKNRTPTVIDV